MHSGKLPECMGELLRLCSSNPGMSAFIRPGNHWLYEACTLEQSQSFKAIMPTAPDDQMVMQNNAHGLGGGFNLLGHVNVGTAWGRIA